MLYYSCQGKLIKYRNINKGYNYIKIIKKIVSFKIIAKAYRGLEREYYLNII